MKRLVMDLDDTITAGKGPNGYSDAAVNMPVVEKMREYKKMGFEIVIHTARNMRTYNGNPGKIQALTLPVILDWLTTNGIPFDEVITAKPWCGTDGFYVDDRAIRPNEFVALSLEEIHALINSGKSSAGDPVISAK